MAKITKTNKRNSNPRDRQKVPTQVGKQSKPPKKGAFDRPRPQTDEGYHLVASPKVSFPAAWGWFFDEAIPSYVKAHYSPRESWKDKPFSKEDAIFFSKGIIELSELFTTDRPKNMPSYFQHPRFRSAYLLYWLSLQASKFLSVFNLQPRAMRAALDHAKKEGVLRVLDLGAGPGTASIALLLWLLDTALREGIEIPQIEMDWLDNQREIMADGKTLAELLASNFPRLRGKLTLRTHVADWWTAPSRVEPDRYSFVFMGNVLNESSAQHLDLEKVWPKLLDLAGGAGLLMLEPAARGSSQLLSRTRDSLIARELVEETPASIWGPCLHAAGCPLAEGRDWCHFSVPVQIPGTWFREFSKALSTERQWAKFSYLWLSSTDARAPIQPGNLRRVVSDPIKKDRTTTRPDVLLCEPERPARLPISPRAHIYRGDLIKLHDTDQLKREHAPESDEIEEEDFDSSDWD